MMNLSATLMPKKSSAEMAFCRACRPEGTVPVSRYLRGNRVVERALAAMMYCAALPLIGILVVLIRLTSKGPGLFRQRRVGRNGIEYTMYKLRTMRLDAEVGTGPVWSVHGDARLTRLGRILRKFHLDELPQLLNVAKGEMSLVGPRPERPEFVAVLEEQVPGYCERLRVRPGITGLAQVNLPPDSGELSVRRKVRLDLEYIQTAGLRLDLQIILCTFLKLLFIPSGLRARWTGVDRSACLAEVNGAEAIIALTPGELAQPRNNGHRPKHSAKPHKAK